MGRMTRTLKDGAGADFTVAFFDDGGAGLLPFYQVIGRTAEVSSAQATLASGTAVTITRAVGAVGIELYIESGAARVRADGSTATATTGIPLGTGFVGRWDTATVSMYAASALTYTAVHV